MARSRFGRVLLASLLACVAIAPIVTLPAHAQDMPSLQLDAAAPDSLSVGSTVIVTASDCLRLRAEPSLASRQLTCIPAGRTAQVIEGTAEADGHTWQRVQYGVWSGWVSAEFLSPYEGLPQGSGCIASIAPPGISGELPPQGGPALIVWGGGSLRGLETAALTGGCRLASVWTTRPAGGFVGYLPDAPAFVNREWTELAGQDLPAGTPLLLLCGGPASAISNVSASSAVVPAPSAAAPARTGVAAPPRIDARAAVVIDEASGEVLFDLNARVPMPPASLTKIVTAVLAIEGMPANAWVGVDDVDWRRMPGSSVMGIIPGDCFSVRDLLYGLMLPSGNDAALAIARYQAGSDQAFIAQMHTLMRRLGLTDSSFTDPHGLGSATHRMSAYDIAMIARYGMLELPLFRDIVRARNWTANGFRELSMLNTNSILAQYVGADGIKTGYTEQAGRTLAASAVRDGRRLYAVILNDDNRYTDAALLFDWAFSNHTWAD